MIAIWLFAIGIVFGGALIVILGLIVFGLNYLSGGKVFKVIDAKNEINTDDVKSIINCPICNAKLKVPTNKKIEVICNFCKHKWITET
jgi:hypothetical protein